MANTNTFTFYFPSNANVTSCTLTVQTTDYPTALSRLQAILSRNGPGVFVDDNGILHSSSQVISAYIS